MPSVIPVSAACFVLDEYLLLAHHDGVLRAHPRRNPRSVYHVEDVGSLVPHMTSLFNVVALIRNYCVLEVRRVFKRSNCEDPFIGFELLFSTPFVDCDYAPLLYGPHVVFRGLDGVWFRVCYDNDKDNDNVDKKKSRLPIPQPPPYTAANGWTIQSIHSATMVSLSMTLKHIKSGQMVNECVCLG